MKRTLTFLGFAVFLLSATWTNVYGQHAEVSNFKGVYNQTQRTILLTWWALGDAAFTSQIVEHSTNGTSFRRIAEIPVIAGRGGKLYQYLHSTPVPGSNYYRLALMFADGTYVYSETIKVDANARPILSGSRPRPRG